MNEVPTPKQALILWCLLGRQGSALQSEIIPRIGRAEREALISARFLSSEKQGRSLKLTVTDKGWNWAGSHLRDPLPAGFRVLQDWLERVGHHLDATGTTLADLIGTPPEQPATVPNRWGPAQVAAGKTAKPRRAAKPGGLNPARLRARIEEAYLALTKGRKAEAVRLSGLRTQLSDLDRATVDAGLAAILRGDRTARLSQFSDPRSLDAAEREAAYSPAGEPFHIIWIQA